MNTHDKNDKSDGSHDHDGGAFRLSPQESPGATYAGVDAVSDLLRRMTGLIEQSTRSVCRARETLVSETVLTAGTVTSTEQLLTSAADDLERMSELVHAAMQGKQQALGSPHLSRARPVTLGEAIQHAVDVCRALALKHRVQVSVDVCPSLAGVPAGAVYTVALNAVQNAIEAIARRGGDGRVEVELRRDAAPKETSFGRDERAWCILEVRDDGDGLAKNAGDGRVFRLGYTTKQGGAGVGLSVAKSVVQGMGGTIDLVPRVVVRSVEHGAGHENATAPGCTLRVRFPALIGAGVSRLSA